MPDPFAPRPRLPLGDLRVQDPLSDDPFDQATDLVAASLDALAAGETSETAFTVDLLYGIYLLLWDIADAQHEQTPRRFRVIEQLRRRWQAATSAAGK